MLSSLLRFEALYQSKQYALPILSLIFFLMGYLMGGDGQAPAQVNYNSAYQVSYSTSLFTLTTVFIVMFFAVSGLLRDKRYQMEPLLFSTPVDKISFFTSRFIGVFIFSLLSFSTFLIGFWLGVTTSDLDTSRIAPFSYWTYLWPFLVIVLPNVFFCSALIFSVSALSKNAVATYSSAVLIYILYFITAFYSNSPILAGSIPASPEAMKVAALIDPFAAATFFEHTHFWTPYDKSHMALSFSDLYLWNRLLWISISMLVLVVTYNIFSFRKKSERANKNPESEIVPPKLTPYTSVPTNKNLTSQWSAFISLLRIDIRGIFRSLPFLAVLLSLVISTVMELYSRIFEGGAYGDSWYPFTHLLIELVMELVPILSLILIAFYAGELIWKDKSYKFDGIINSSPTKSWVFFLSKLTTLSLLPLLMIATTLIICIGFQLLNGYYNIDLHQYLGVFYYHGLSLIIFCMVAIFIQCMARHKYLGIGLTALAFILLGTSYSQYIGLEHPMLRLAYMPLPVFSDMSGYTVSAKAFDMYAIYWVSFGVLLSVLSFKKWDRGVFQNFRVASIFKSLDWKHWELAISISALLTFSISGGVIYNNINKYKSYTSSEESMNHAEAYERKFMEYDSIPRLHYLDMKTQVDIYPSRDQYSISADYLLTNKNDIPVKRLFLSERKILETVAVDSASLVFKDTVFGTYLFEFDKPIQPQGQARLKYSFTKVSSPYKVDKTIVSNGTYIRHEIFEPVLGYHDAREISDPHERQKRSLPIQEFAQPGDAHLTSQEARLGMVHYETIVSTATDQTALASGNLIRQWKQDNRNFYNYKFPEKNIPSLAYFSAAYDLKEDKYKDIALEYYYHPEHDMNHITIDTCTKVTLDYCISNFGNYNFDHLRIAEVPGYFGYGGAAHPGLINMVEDNLYLIDIRNTGTFDLVSKRTIHEVAHQWWGMMLTPKGVNGASFVIEGFAKYTEGVILEKMYGKGALWQLNKESNRRYWGGKAFAKVKEPPVYLQDNEGYLAYGKNALVLLSIRDLIGEEKLNQVLRTLLVRHHGHVEFEATTLEFLDELYKVTPLKYQTLIDDWMKKVIRYDIKIKDVQSRKLNNNTFEIELYVDAKRFETMGNGQENEIGIDEPLLIGIFKDHPKNLGKGEHPIYLKAHRINERTTSIKITTDEIPHLVSIDPFLTRVEQNYTDNIKTLE